VVESWLVENCYGQGTGAIHEPREAEIMADLEKMEATVNIGQEELKVTYLETKPEAMETVVERQEVHKEMNKDTIGALED
jgi:hypothetical protein